MSEFMEQVRELTHRDRKTLEQRAMKLAEEVGEVNEALLVRVGAHGTGYKVKTNLNVAEECVDVMIVAASILAHMDVSDWELGNLVAKKLAKWEHVLYLEDDNG